MHTCKKIMQYQFQNPIKFNNILLEDTAHDKARTQCNGSYNVHQSQKTGQQYDILYTDYTKTAFRYVTTGYIVYQLSRKTAP